MHSCRHWNSPLAVTAIIGIRPRPPDSRCRICRVASMPSITGIWMSIRIKSKLSCSIASTAACPLATATTCNPRVLRIRASKVWLTGLSSAISTLRIGTSSPAALAGGTFPPAGEAGASSTVVAGPTDGGSTAIGSSTVNRLPRPSSLSTVKTPPKASTSLFTIARPSPAPPCRRRRVPSNCRNGSKIAAM